MLPRGPLALTTLVVSGLKPENPRATDTAFGLSGGPTLSTSLAGLPALGRRALSTEKERPSDSRRLVCDIGGSVLKGGKEV